MFNVTPQHVPSKPRHSPIHDFNQSLSSFLPQVRPSEDTPPQQQREHHPIVVEHLTDDNDPVTGTDDVGAESITPEDNNEVIWNPDMPVRNRQSRTAYDASTGNYLKPVEWHCSFPFPA